MLGASQKHSFLAEKEVDRCSQAKEEQDITVPCVVVPALAYPGTG